MRFRIHLVEDDSHSVDLIREALQELNIECDLQVSSDGEEAIRALHLRPEKPHLILLDLNLPKKTGIEVLKVVKASPTLKMIPVIVLTNSNSPEDVFKAYINHCNAYVRKPFHFQKLVDAVKLACGFWFDLVTLPDPNILPTPTMPPETPPSSRN